MWIDVKAKKARNSGTEGTGRKKVPIKARKMRDGCDIKCRFRCYENISIDARIKAFSEF